MIEDAMYPAFPFTPTPLRRAVIGMPAHQAGDADREYRLIRHAPSFARRNPGFTPRASSSSARYRATLLRTFDVKLSCRSAIAAETANASRIVSCRRAGDERVRIRAEESLSPLTAQKRLPANRTLASQPKVDWGRGRQISGRRRQTAWLAAAGSRGAARRRSREPEAGPPVLRHALCQRVTPHTPVSDPVVIGRLRSRSWPSLSAKQVGPHDFNFRGLLGLHSCCGPLACRPTPGGPMSRELQRFGYPPHRLGSYWGAPTIPQAGLAPARAQHLFTARSPIGVILRPRTTGHVVPELGGGEWQP
jgi:hypothetical protein